MTESLPAGRQAPPSTVKNKVTFSILGGLILIGAIFYFLHSARVSETTMWEHYQNEKYHLEMKYPSQYRVYFDEGIGESYINFVDHEENLFTLEIEGLNHTPCFLRACDELAKETVTSNNITWDVLGVVSYCWEGCVTSQDTYRAFRDKSRYYLAFFSTSTSDADKDKILRNIKFTQ